MWQSGTIRGAALGLALGVSLAVAPMAPLAMANTAETDTHITVMRFIKKVTAKGLAWYRVLDSGSTVILTAQEAHAMGLNAIEIVGEVVTVLIRKELDDVQDIIAAGEYIAVEVILPGVQAGAGYTVDVIIPTGWAYAEGTFQTVWDWSDEVLVPGAAALAASGAELAQDGMEYTTQTLLPGAAEAAGDAAEAVSKWVGGISW